MRPENARVNREVVDPLCRLMLERVENDLLVEVVQLAADDHRIDRHGADRDGAVLDDRFAALIEVAAGGEVHHGVGPPAFGPLEFVDFFIGAAGDRRGSHIGVDLRLRRPPDRHRIELVAQVNLVRGNDHAPGCDFVAHLNRREMPFPLGDACHLGRDDAEAGVF